MAQNPTDAEQTDSLTTEIRRAADRGDMETAQERTRELWDEQTEFDVEADRDTLTVETEDMRAYVGYGPEGLDRDALVVYERVDDTGTCCVEIEAEPPLALVEQLNDVLKDIRAAQRERREARRDYRRRAL